MAAMEHDHIRFAARRKRADLERRYDHLLAPALGDLPADASTEDICAAISTLVGTDDALAEELNHLTLEMFIEDYLIEKGFTPARLDADGDVIYEKAE